MYFYLVLVLCLIAAIFTVWKEYRVGKPRLNWRILASLLAAIALAGIALPWSYPGENSLTLHQAVLLTPGFITDNLNKYKNDSLLTFDPSVKKQYNKAKLITPDQVKMITPRISILHVFGYGLSKDELRPLDSLSIAFHPAAAPSGITAITWSDRIKSGQSLKVQGTFNNVAGKLLKIVLKGLNTVVDSAIISGENTSKFELTSVPKGIGPSVFQLITIAGDDTLSNDKLPFVIEPVKPLKILMLAASPNFENKFLKNWLTENGFAVAFRSAISKDRFNTEFINIPQGSLNNLSSSLFSKFDVLISDLSVLKSLSSAESFALKQQVTTKGLGMIVKTDTNFKTPLWEQAGFQFIKPAIKENKPSPIIIDGKNIAFKISLAGQMFVNEQPGTISLVNDDQGRSLAGINIAGEGRIAVTALTNTYTWMLGGDKNGYSLLWSTLIGKTAHETIQPDAWQTVAEIPVVNGPVQLQVETGAQVGRIGIDSVLLSPVQNPEMPFQWRSTWWPRAAGWHNTALTGGSPAWFYIYDSARWASVKAAQKIIQTKKYTASTKHDPVTTLIHQKVKKPVPKVYFYLLLLGACTFLWIEEKFSSVGV